MKITLLFFLLAIAGNSILSQSFPLSPNPAKGNNLIIIKTSKSASENYQEFGKHLVANGFTFENKDAEFFFLTTAPKSPKKGYDYKLNITFEDTVIVIRGQQSLLSFGAFTMGNHAIDWMKWSFTKTKTDYRNKSFLNFYPVLQKYNCPIFFTTEN